MLDGYKCAVRVSCYVMPVDIRCLIDFYNTYADKQEAVAQEMRQYAIDHFTWEKILEDV